MSERPPVTVRRLALEDWAVWRSVRLAALQDAPGAFASTYDAERRRTDAQWREWLVPERGLKAVAEVDGAPAGIIGGWLPDPGDDGLVELYSMWVAPGARRRGVGAALVDEVVRWARERSTREVLLWVARGNDDAERLYAGLGFVRTGEEQPLPSHPCSTEIAMRLDLAVDPAA